MSATLEVYQCSIQRARQEAKRSLVLIQTDPEHADTWRRRFHTYNDEEVTLRMALYQEHGVLYRKGKLVLPIGVDGVPVIAGQCA